MLKSVVMVAVLASTASAERRTYDVKATRRSSTRNTCGALDRMMKDKHILAIDEENDLVGVDGFRWHIISNEPNLVIMFHDQNGQKTYLTMDLYVNRRGLTGKYILNGVIPDKDNPRSVEYCQDVVYIDGTRR